MSVNYWIFNVKDDKDDKYSKKGIEIYNHNVGEYFWGLKELATNGRRAARGTIAQYLSFAT